MPLRLDGSFAVVVAVMVAMSAVLVGAVVETASPQVDLDDMLGTSPVSRMVKSIDAGIEDEVSHAEKAIDHESEVPVSAVLDDDIEKAAELREHHSDIGEGDNMAEGVGARAAVKAKVRQALREAQAALAKASSKNQLPVAAAKPVAKPTLGETKAVPKPSQNDDGNPIFEGEDPIDAMRSAISSEVHQSMLKSTAPSADDPLDQAIAKISVVRAEEKAKRRAMKAKKKGAEPSSVLSLLQEAEEQTPGITGDTGQTIPPSNNAPDTGKKNPAVKENTPMLPSKVPLGRSTPQAPSGGAALDTVLASQKGAPSSTGPSTPPPPPPDKKFSQDEIKSEIKSINRYPIDRDEAINEAVKQLVPWDQRPEKPMDPKAKGPALSTASTPPPAPAGANSTANSTDTFMY